MDSWEDAVLVGVSGRRNSDRRDYKVLMDIAGDSTDFAVTLRGAAYDGYASGRTTAPGQATRSHLGFRTRDIPLAVAMSYEFDMPAVIAYKTRLDLPGELSWSEPFYVNSTFYFYVAQPGLSMLLVDDEVDGGDTMCTAVHALHDSRIHIAGVGSAVAVLHSGISRGRARQAGLGLTLTSVRTVDVDTEPRVPAVACARMEATNA